MAEKTENIYKKARLAAAERDKGLSTAEKAADRLYGISRERMYMIEQDDPHKRQAEPTPQDVVGMAKLYNAPELCDHYCTNVCSIGLARAQEPLLYDDLGKISARLMAALHFLEQADDQLHRILADSRVSQEEAEEFSRVIRTLEDIAYSTESLLLWARKNGFEPAEI